MKVNAYFHLGKGYLRENDLLEDVELTDEVETKLNYFGYEHEVSAEIDTTTGEYVITHLDGRKIEPKN